MEVVSDPDLYVSARSTYRSAEKARSGVAASPDAAYYGDTHAEVTPDQPWESSLFGSLAVDTRARQDLAKVFDTARPRRGKTGSTQDPFEKLGQDRAPASVATATRLHLAATADLKSFGGGNRDDEVARTWLPRGVSDPEIKLITKTKGRAVMFTQCTNEGARTSSYGGRLGGLCGDAFLSRSEVEDQEDWDEDQRQVAAVAKRSGGPVTSDRKPCGICGSKLHRDDDCWRNLKCTACGRSGHPRERCLRICKACDETHERGECKLKELFNQLRMWAEGQGNVLPAHIEKLLN